ncbi:MAG: tRNA pseudouridine(38-40) synthase TruA [Coriobacteriia bacterium]|nr:tRNA pseudouridine(38-40) synthase TruA [Coriobacteriia bacterium]
MSESTTPPGAGLGATPAESGATALTVAYNGQPFAGFARQPGQDTVQGRLEVALSTILRREIVTACAGRTDAGVHALGQVVSFPTIGGEPDDVALLRSLNALVGEDISVREVRRARQGFSARFDAVSREYRYRLVSGPVPPLFLSPVAWWVKTPLDVEAVRAAASHLVGEHDFRSFCVTISAAGKRTTRRVTSIDLFVEQALGEECLTVRVVGNAFLHSMVRTIVGTLVEVGSGRRDPQWVLDALEAQRRAAAGPTAPANGLMLWSVGYPEEVWVRG